MVEYKNVQGTQKEVPILEIDKDTVYVRSNIHRTIVEMDEDYGPIEVWEYDEQQYGMGEYLNKALPENQATTDAAIAELSMLIASMQGA